MFKYNFEYLICSIVSPSKKNIIRFGIIKDINSYKMDKYIETKNMTTKFCAQFRMDNMTFGQNPQIAANSLESQVSFKQIIYGLN